MLIATVLGVACPHRPMTGRMVQERAVKIWPCYHGPQRDSAARAVARWDGNVALQRWGCGRCRRRDGGGMSGCEVAVLRHVRYLFLSLLIPFPSLYLCVSFVQKISDLEGPTSIVSDLFLFVSGVTGQVRRTGSSKQPYSQDKPSKSRVINNRVSKRCV